MGITFLADLVGFFVGYVSQFLDYIVHVVFCPADPDLAKDKAMFLAKGHAVLQPLGPVCFESRLGLDVCNTPHSGIYAETEVVIISPVLRNKSITA